MLQQPPNWRENSRKLKTASQPFKHRRRLSLDHTSPSTASTNCAGNDVPPSLNCRFSFSGSRQTARTVRPACMPRAANNCLMKLTPVLPVAPSTAIFLGVSSSEALPPLPGAPLRSITCSTGSSSIFTDISDVLGG